MPKRSEVDGSSRPTELLVICAARSSWLVCVFAPSRVVTTEMPTDAPMLRERLSRLDPSVRCCGAIVANAIVFKGMKISPMPSRSEEDTSELPSIMRNSYDVLCLIKKNTSQHV